MIWNTIHEKYTGQWVNDKQEGIGIQTWYQPRGEQRYLYNRYVGEWKEGKCRTKEGTSCGTRKFPGQGSNPHHSRNQSHGRDNTRA